MVELVVVKQTKLFEVNKTPNSTYSHRKNLTANE